MSIAKVYIVGLRLNEDMATHKYEDIYGINAVLTDGYLKERSYLLKTTEEVAREPDASWSKPYCLR